MIEGEHVITLVGKLKLDYYVPCFSDVLRLLLYIHITGLVPITQYEEHQEEAVGERRR